jgi:hypothetical protein
MQVAAISFGASALVVWAMATALTLRAHVGQRFSVSWRSPISVRLLRSAGVVLLAFGAGAFFHHHHDAARLVVAVLFVAGALMATTVVPILARNLKAQPAAP